MAKFRHIQTTFWNDPKVAEEMTAEDRYFFLYLLTNEYTKQIGVYSISKKIIAFQIGHSIESVNQLIARFEQHHKLIKYNEETREIAIKNWGKHNLNKGGKPILDCIEKELKEVKDKSLLKVVIPSITSEAILHLFNLRLHDSWTTSGQKEKEKEKKDICANDAQVCELDLEEEIDIKEKESFQKKVQYSKEFEALWEVYPKKKDKKAAYAKFKIALKSYSFDEIFEGVKNYAIECNMKKIDQQYIKHLKTFLFNESFTEYQKQETKEKKVAVFQPIGKNKNLGDGRKWKSSKDSSTMKKNGSGLL